MYVLNSTDDRGITEKLLAESPQRRQDLIDKILPFVILPFRVSTVCCQPSSV